LIAIIAPEPVPWLDSAVKLARAIARDEPVEVFAPWALPDRAPWRALARRVPFARRRVPAGLDGARCRTRAAWPLAELALAAWIGGRTDRRLAALFWRRAAADRLAARSLAGRRDLRCLIAPSGAAERSFALAAERGAGRVLLEDLPGLRQLHEDLDAAAAAHPDCRFLRRYRAPHSIIARQEAEWALADELLVRGRFARAVRAAAGLDGARVVDWATADPEGAARDLPAGPARATSPARRRILLAGLAAARHGTAEALALLRAREDIELVLRIGEGFEPGALATHPRVARASADPLAGVDLVIAPSWCEAYPAELARAARLDIPIVATSRAAGFLDVHTVHPGDGDGLIAAVDSLLAAPRAG
jgi:hypothetical protein